MPSTCALRRDSKSESSLPVFGRIRSSGCIPASEIAVVKPCTTRPQNGLRKNSSLDSSSTRATNPLRPPANRRAVVFGTKLYFLIALRTAFSVSGETLALPFITRETVARLTPAVSATKSIVTSKLRVEVLVVTD